MPRICICIGNFRAKRHNEKCERALNFCRECAEEADAEDIRSALYNTADVELPVENVQEQFEALGGFTHEHPDYSDPLEDPYICVSCGKKLDEYDN